ncbi:hypothetical protein ACOME3_005579 [Neoechinorhynchus agilis]
MMYICSAFAGILLMLTLKGIKSQMRRIRRRPRIDDSDPPGCFIHPTTGERIPRPNIKDPPSLYLSVIVPAYNEEKRMPVTIQSIMKYLNRRQGKGPFIRRDIPFTFEVIIVDDGSSDRTFEIGQRLSMKYGFDKLRVLRLPQNKGKGAAIRLGVFSSRGRYILFTDADNATDIKELERFEHRSLLFDANQDWVICGSRVETEDQVVVERSMFRNILTNGFHVFVRVFGVSNVKDTQCGFKLFPRATAELLFKNLHLKRWAFDVELLYVAEQLKIQADEVAISWKEVSGSKVIPFFTWISMAYDIFRMWFKYNVGIYGIETN